MIFCFGLCSVIFSFAALKHSSDAKGSNMNSINRPFLHFHPIYAFLKGPTNHYISNDSRAFILLTIIACNLFYSLILTLYPIDSFPLERVALISAGTSIVTIYIFFGFLSFIKIGMNNNIAFKSSSAYSKSAFGGFGYNYLIKIISLLSIIAS